MPGTALTREDREEIYAGIKARETDVDIAKSIGRSPSTISREVSKNGGRKKYKAFVAQARADEKRKRPKACKLVADKALCEEVLRLLKDEKLSPCVIAHRLAKEGKSISHETIYQGIYAQGTRGLQAGLHRSLHRQRRCRKHKRSNAPQTTGKANPPGLFNLIHLRPSIACRRTEAGHWEGDLIVGAANGSAVVTLIDRATYFGLLGVLPLGHDAGEVLFTLCDLFDRIPDELRRTLTWDQGREMARHQETSEIVGIETYFCDPHSPWQRPSNENYNGLVRRWLPKGSDLSIHTQADLDVIANRVNNMPRRSLDWDSAHERYSRQTVALTA